MVYTVHTIHRLIASKTCPYHSIMIKNHSSHKKRNRATTSSPLHEIAKTTPTGIGAYISTAQRVLPGKGNIWIEEDVDDSILSLCSSRESVLPFLQSNTNRDVCLEIMRSDKVKFLRQRLKDLCKSSGLIPPIYAWERWQARCMLNKLQTQNRAQLGNINHSGVSVFYGGVGDEMIPCVRDFIDPGLVRDLTRASFPEAEATAISTALSLSSSNCVSQMVEYSKSLSDADASCIRILIVQHKHTLDVSSSHSRNSIFKLNNAHFSHMRELYMKFCSKYSDDVAAFQEDHFHKRLFVVLSRYHSLQGHGFQAALNEHSFHVLLSRLDVRFECFASPLNSTCRSYSSAFLSSDIFFGSAGNFFSFR